MIRDQQDEEEAARLAADGAGRVTGNAAPVNKRVKDRQTVFASATVPQHNHFIKQCVQKQWTLTEPVHVQVHAKEAMPPGLSHFYVVCPPEQKLAVLRALVRRELGVSPSSASPVAEARATPMASGTGELARAQTDRPPSPGVGAPSDGGDGKADNRGLVFALATKPLEAIAGSLWQAKLKLLSSAICSLGTRIIVVRPRPCREVAPPSHFRSISTPQVVIAVLKSTLTRKR